MVGSSEDDLVEEVYKPWEDLVKTKDKLKNAPRKTKKHGTGKKFTSEEGCYGCGKKGPLYQKLPKMKGQHAILVAGPVKYPVAEKRSSRVGELLSKEDALCVTGRDRRHALEENNVEMRSANGSLLPDHWRVQLRVKRGNLCTPSLLQI